MATAFPTDQERGTAAFYTKLTALLVRARYRQYVGDSNAANKLLAVLQAASGQTADLVGIFLGSASDKTIPVTNDTVTAIYTILKLPALTPEQTATIAADAEAVRLAILAGHG